MCGQPCQISQSYCGLDNSGLPCRIVTVWAIMQDILKSYCLGNHVATQGYFVSNHIQWNLCLMGPKKVVLYDSWSFIGGTNIYRNVGLCCSCVKSITSVEWSIIIYIYEMYLFICYSLKEREVNLSDPDDVRPGQLWGSWDATQYTTGKSTHST